MIEYYKNFSLENLFYINEKGLVCQEEFRDVLGYEGLYQVSDLGRVKSLNYRKTKVSGILKLSKDKDGYYRICLCNKNVKQAKGVHVLQAMVFLGHIPCGYEIVVDHKNFIKYDNRLENLQVVTQRRNVDKRHLPSTSSYVGVFWSKRSKKWVSSIYYNKKRIHLGYFDSEEEASQYYENALKSIETNSEIVSKDYGFTSKHKGIHWDKRSKKWIARVCVNFKRKVIGYFINEQDAYLAICNLKKTI
jgi:hypothetical protein